MILDNPERIKDIFSDRGDELVEFNTAIGFIVSKSKEPIFYSNVVPGLEDVAKWIAFSYYKDTAYYTVSYKNGSILSSEVSKSDSLDDYVFTNCLLDLNTLTPVNKEDVIERIAKEKSR